MIRGKESVVVVLTLMGILATIIGPQFMFHYAESGIEYNVYLESFNRKGDVISGSVLIKITNTNDFDVSVTQIQVKLFDPTKTNPFESISDQGGSLLAGETTKVSKNFEFLYSQIPEYEIRVVLSAYVVWNSQGDWVDKEWIKPIEWMETAVI